jgi:hypothetical protein
MNVRDIFPIDWNCKDPVNRKKWRIATKKEVDCMESREVWDVL